LSYFFLHASVGKLFYLLLLAKAKTNFCCKHKPIEPITSCKNTLTEPVNIMPSAFMEGQYRKLLDENIFNVLFMAFAIT
jgi:hypothetical protein